MNAMWPYIVFALALASVGAASRGKQALMNGIAWVVLAAGFAFLLWTPASVAAAAAVAAIAGFAAVPGLSSDPARRIRISAFAAVVPVTIAGVTTACVPDAVPIWGRNLVLFAAAWAGLIAAATCFVAAMGVQRRPLSTSVGVAVVGAVLGVTIAGSGRSSLPDAFYGLTLRTGDEVLRWVLGPVQGFESGIRLAVAAPAPEMDAVFSAIGLLGGVVAVAAYLGRQRLLKASLWLVGVGSGLFLAALPVVVGRLAMPPSGPYEAEIKRRLLARGGERAIDSGAFNSTANITVAMIDLGPEVLGLLFIATLAIVAALAVQRDDGAEVDIDRAFGRDLLVRGVAFLWGAWFVILVIHNGFIGSPGMGSPGEWVFTGVCILASGLAFAGWTPPTTRLGKALVDLLPGLIVAALFITAGLAWRFGALIGLSLGILG